MKFELQCGNIDGFAELLNTHWELSKQLDKGSTNTCIDQIFVSIEDLIDGRFISGAGGGGFLQVIMKKGVTRQMLSRRLNNPVPVSLLSGDRKPQIRFLGNHHSGSGNLYHKSFRM